LVKRGQPRDLQPTKDRRDTDLMRWSGQAWVEPDVAVNFDLGKVHASR
jgi:hypothetical protein